MTARALKPLFLNRAEVVTLTGRSTASLDRDIKAGRFPAPRQIGPRRVGWLMSDIERWAESCPASTILPPPSRSARPAEVVR